MELHRARQTVIVALSILAFGASSAGSAACLAAQQGRPSLDKVLRRWADGYEKGALQLKDLAVVRGKVDPVYGSGWIGGGRLLDMTHRAGLAALLKHAGESATVPITQAILRLASIGLLEDKASFERPHYAVRHLAGLALRRCTGTSSMSFLLRIADGDFSGWRRRPRDRVSARAAAILALGSMGRAVVRPMLQQQLRAEQPIVRIAAADALQTHNPRALLDLSAAMAVETDPVAAQALVMAVEAILARHEKRVDARHLGVALDGLLALLGRADWRVDLEIVELLARLRSPRAVSPLIDVLQRYSSAAAGGGEDPGGSRRVWRAASETLRSLTGAILGSDDPQEWRDYWAEVEDGFVVPPAPKAPVKTRTAAGFFGLPVEGSNVVFILDTSGSMRTGFYPTGSYDPDPENDGLTRLGIAKRELMRAVDELSKDARFNVVSFASEVRAWRRDLVRASGKQRRALAESVRKMSAAGATNVFGALREALDIRTLKYGSRYGVEVDEIFLLSDGEPTAGEVTDREMILQLIRETNRFSKVRIHTIYMGGGGGSVLMQKLAEQNGGRYVQL